VPRSTKHDILFEPITIGPKVMRNRFYQTPHCCGFGVEYPGAQAYMRAMKAEGGWAAVNTEYFAVHPESDDGPWVQGRIIGPDDVTNLRLMVDRVHAHGALAGIQLNFSGPDHTGYGSRLASRGVSQLTSTLFGGSCWEMSKAEIRDLQEAYVRAAKLARDAGMDIINVHGREVASITQQFLMPFWNKRTDEYGGSLENRARFWIETLELVRGAVGTECAIACGLCVDSHGEGGEDGIKVEEDGIGFVQLADHLVDLWDVQVAEFLEDAGPSRYFEQNSQRRWVEQVRAHTTKPIAGVGRFTDPDVMVAAIRSGQLDIIGAARPSIADPFLPKKIEEGRYDDIRECIGCNMCASRFLLGGSRIVCTQNPTMGEEYRRGWHPERFDRATNADRAVLVVGAGPAGMECARVLGMRGMAHVHLVDAGPEIGGVMRWIPSFRGLGEWARVTNYRRIQLDKLKNVQVITGTELTADDVREYGAELVVIATGAHWSKAGLNPITHRDLPGWDDPRVNAYVPEDLMVNGAEVHGERVLVYDTDGYFMGPSIAERLADQGKDVTLVTYHTQVGSYLFVTGEGKFMNRRLLQLGVELYPNHIVTEVKPGTVQGAHMYSDQPVVWPADAVVFVTQRVSNAELYQELTTRPEKLSESDIEGVYRIGDCLEPRVIADVIFDGHRLAREIDSPDPSQPLPFIREHRVLGKSDEDYDALLVKRCGAFEPSSSVDRTSQAR
jgi:dimethylamine/trimethylamine dehydrogenase